MAAAHRSAPPVAAAGLLFSASKFHLSKNYENNPVALQLRGMNMLFEGLKDNGSLMIVPSSALESMNIGALGGLSALAELHKTGKKQAAVPIEKIEG